MKMRASYVGWVIPLFLTACFSPFHKAQPKQDQLFAPPVANLPKPPVEHADLPDDALLIPEQPMATEADMEQEPVPPARHHRPPPPKPQAAPNTVATVDENTGVSAIGQLSTGELGDLRRETEDSIAQTERGLAGLRRNLSDSERKTVAQIREYLKQAREALISGDVDGAHTLAIKAKAVLSDLRR